MTKVYITSHVCKQNEARTYRYWIANDENSKLIHLGVADIDGSFMQNLLSHLDVALIRLDMPDDSFKQLMLAEGYEK